MDPLTHCKICPECQASSELNAAKCAKCGHQFRTQFIAPPEDTTLVVALPSSVLTNQQQTRSAAPRRRNIFISLAAVLGLLILATFSFIYFRPSPPARPVSGQSPGPVTHAWRDRVSEGQSPQEVIAALGEPNQKMQIDTKDRRGQAWDFDCGDGTITVYIDRDTQSVWQVTMTGNRFYHQSKHHRYDLPPR